MSGPLLDSLEIVGFRGFRHLRVERLGRVNLIVGRNNVGKTSLLEAVWLYASGGAPSAIWDILEVRDEAGRPLRQNGLGFSRRERIRDPALALRHLLNGRPDLRKKIASVRIGPLGDSDQTLTLTPGWSVYEPVGERVHFRSISVVDVNIAEDAVLTVKTQLGDRPLAEFPLTADSFSFPSQAGGFRFVFIPSNGLTFREFAEFWDAIALTDLEADVVSALKIIESDIERINLLSDPGRENETERVPKVKLKGMDEPLLLRSLGDGMNRLFGIALALANAKSGILLIDEVENGLHYSVQGDIWLLIFQTAARLDVQVFATTHSWDCISAFQSASTQSEEDGMLVRLEEKNGEVTPTLFDRRRLEIATKEDIEIR